MATAVLLGGVRPAAAQPRLLRPEGGAAAPNAHLQNAVALFLARGGAGPTAVGARPVAVSMLETGLGHGGGFVGGVRDAVEAAVEG